MKIVDYDTGTDWPKLGPSMLIATAMVVAIRTARWPAEHVKLDINQELDLEVEFAAKITDRVLKALVQKSPALFPSKRHPVYEPGEDSPA